MKIRPLLLVLSCITLSLSDMALAQRPNPSARPHPSASSTLPSASTSSRVPNNPQTGDPSNPHAGNPHAGDPHGGDPHAGGNPHAGGGGDPELDYFQPYPDGSQDDPGLPKGTIRVVLRSERDLPLADREFTLATMQTSVSKGEGRSHKTYRTDATGTVTIPELESGSGVAYRLSVTEGDAKYAATPFQLSLERGRTVTLHVYPTTNDLRETLVLIQAIAYVELRDDRIQTQQAWSVTNLGRKAWVPKDVVIPVPPGFTGFEGMQAMGDHGVDKTDNGLRLRGTFGPGRTDVEFRYQIPFADQSSVDLNLGLPPHTAAARVMVTSSEGMKVSVDGFPAATPSVDNQGNRIVTTMREIVPGDNPLDTLRISIRDIPVPGPARFYVAGVAAFLIAVGIAVGSKKAPKANRVAEQEDLRADLTAELKDLVAAHQAGEVGPKAFEREKRALLLALRKTFG